MSDVMIAKGSFEIDLQARTDKGYPAGRMVIDKVYSGDMIGSGKGQMISKRTQAGAAVYYAVEEFAGSISGRKGALTLVHKGYMTSESQVLEVEILNGSGVGELKNLSGSMTITQDGGGHTYELVYEGQT